MCLCSLLSVSDRIEAVLMRVKGADIDELTSLLNELQELADAMAAADGANLRQFQSVYSAIATITDLIEQGRNATTTTTTTTTTTMKK